MRSLSPRALAAAVGLILLAVLSCTKASGDADRSRRASGPAAEPSPLFAPREDSSYLVVYVHGGAADVVVTDPRGRRLGYDAIARRGYDEIPRGKISMIDEDLADQDDHVADTTTAAAAVAPSPVEPKVREVYVVAPATGAYTLAVAGTKVGSYALDVGTVVTDARSSRGAHVDDTPVTPGVVHRYRLTIGPGPEWRAVALWRVR